MRKIGNPKWYRNEDGAIDLASIMVGIIVIGLIGGVIAATVFAVIPWTQDNAAKQQLGSVMQAENAYMGLSSTVPSSLPAGLAANSFGNSADLETAGLLKQGTNYCASTANTGSKGYEGYARSDSGQIFLVSDKNTSPVSFTGTLPANCVFLGSSGAPITYDPILQGTILTYRCDTTQTGTFPMNGSLNGKETWSDGVKNDYTNATNGISRTLNAGVTYTLTFNGTYTSMNSYDNAPAKGLAICLRSVDQWGSGTGVTDATKAFWLARNLTNVPKSIPTTITNMSTMFGGASAFNSPNISQWDVSNVTNMSSMFMSTDVFNQPLSGWNTSNVTNMNDMFDSAMVFNQPIGNWNTSKVTDMGSMFLQAFKFNQPLNSWDTSNVTNMNRTFYNAVVFNQPLNSWKTSNVTNMSWMFLQARAFNQPLNNWNTGNVTDMSAMFQNTDVFNEYIKNWNVSKVTSSANFRLSSALTAANSPF